MEIALAIVAAIVGLAAGAAAGWMMKSGKLSRGLAAARESAAAIVEDAEEEKKRVLLNAQEEALKTRQSAETEVRDRRRELQRTEDRLLNREEGIEKRQTALEQREERIGGREAEIESMRGEVEDLKLEQTRVLESIAQLTLAEAKEQIVETAEGEMTHELARRYYNLEQTMLAEADEKAKKVVALAIQRLASDVVSETTTSIVPLPNDEMKGPVDRAGRAQHPCDRGGHRRGPDHRRHARGRDDLLFRAGASRGRPHSVDAAHPGWPCPPGPD